ncbi:MAG: helix-turn-helix domain-containing protein [Nanoarchaeota archaeon]
MEEESVAEAHIWYRQILELYRKDLASVLPSDLGYTRQVHEAVDRAVIGALEDTVTPKFFEERIRAALERASYPLELIEEVPRKVSKSIERNWVHEYIFFLTKRAQRPSKEELLRTLEENDGNVTKAAGYLGRNRVTLYQWMRDYNIDPEESRFCFGSIAKQYIIRPRKWSDTKDKRFKGIEAQKKREEEEISRRDLVELLSVRASFVGRIFHYEKNKATPWDPKKISIDDFHPDAKYLKWLKEHGYNPYKI